MARVDLGGMSLKQLVDLEQRVKDAISEKRDSERARIKEEMAALAQKHGFSIKEVLGLQKTRSVAIKYRNPENPSETWTGRGRKPNWLSAKLSKGAKIEQFTV